MSEQENYMRRAMDLAIKGMGYVSPNPMVGCVVVKNGKIISEGHHEKYGEFHAERNALLNCKEDTEGADLYVTLEPCCHHGKTPPCTDIIIEKKIKKVYIGCLDSNPQVAGKGVKILKNHGIEVESGILEEECRRMNEIFFHYIKEKKPFVGIKYAMTLDGKIAAVTGDSKWITNELSRKHVQYLRKKYASILVGIGTVKADDPMLNCREWEGCDPVRIIMDSNMSIDTDSNIVKTADRIKTYVVVSKDCNNEEKEKLLKAASVNVLKIETGADGRIDIKKMLKAIGELGIDSVLVEGGGEIHGSFFESGMVNRVYAYIAPKIITGKNAKNPVGGSGIKLMRDAYELKNVDVTRFGDDIMITGRLN